MGFWPAIWHPWLKRSNWTRVVRFWPGSGQIGSKWDKSETFSNKISVRFCFFTWARVVPFVVKLTHFVPSSGHCEQNLSREKSESGNMSFGCQKLPKFWLFFSKELTKIVFFFYDNFWGFFKVNVWQFLTFKWQLSGVSAWEIWVLASVTQRCQIGLDWHQIGQIREFSQVKFWVVRIDLPNVTDLSYSVRIAQLCYFAGTVGRKLRTKTNKSQNVLKTNLKSLNLMQCVMVETESSLLV